MGSVFSIVQSPFRLVESVLGLGDAALAAGTFYPFNAHSFSGLSAIFPFREFAETEPFEDFSTALDDLLCDEHSSTERLSVSPSFPKRPRLSPTATQPTIWKSRTVAAKKLYKVVAVQAQRKALRFQRCYRLYGPPDWTDPALSLLSSSYLLPPASAPNVIPSVFPFAAPHIVISPPSHNPMDPVISLANGIQDQDQAYGNRLIVAEPPSLTGPRPVVVNSVLRRPAQATREKADMEVPDERESDDFSEAPSLMNEGDDVFSNYESSECETIDDSASLPSTTVRGVSFQDVVRPGKGPDFWIEEDEEELPDLPANW